MRDALDGWIERLDRDVSDPTLRDRLESARRSLLDEARE
jgi:hypothetical protein